MQPATRLEIESAQRRFSSLAELPMTPFDATQFIQEVERVTARLKRLDTRRAVFGSSEHQYAFAAPLSEETVAAFETRHGVALPLEYRAFITRIGNGGAGPDYGILPLPPRPPDLKRDWPFDDVYEVADDEEFLELADDGRLLEGPPGAIRIADCGCAAYELLVVTGVHAGEVWFDAQHHYPSEFRPLTARDGTRLRFDSWWLLYMNLNLERLERVRALMNAHAPHDQIHRELDGFVGQLTVDQTMASLMNVDLRGTPKVIPDKPWGLECGRVDEQYASWLRGGHRIE